MNNTNEKYPLFTVIIPQKNRAEYLVHTLKTCVIQDYPNFEVIVSDDCSEDNSVDVINRFAAIDPRIKCYAHTKHLGMRDNFEFALSKVRPGYVMALGGDDGLTAGCIWRMYEILKQTERELLTWPYATFRYANEFDSKSMFYFRRGCYNKWDIIKSEDFLNSIATSFYYLVDKCPMFYIKGVASTTLIDRVKSRTKDHSFYYCPTPDGFSGVVLAGEVEDYVYSYEPLSIGGNTRKSQGQNYMRTDEKSRKEAEQFFNDNIRRTMHSELASMPYSPLIPLMTADYLLTAKDLPGWPGKFKDISFKELIIACFNNMVKEKYANEVLVRELRILREIAKQHHLEDLFNELYRTKKRKVVRTKNVNGFVITHSVRFEGTSLGLNNVFDAAMFLGPAFKFYSRISFKSFVNLLIKEAKVLRREKKYEEEDFPAI